MATKYTFGVPPPHRPLLTKVAQLADDAFERLAVALEGADVTFVPVSELAELIDGVADDWTSDDSRTLITALLGMSAAAYSHSITTKDFVLSLSVSADLDLQAAEQRSLRPRLLRLLS